MSQTGTLFVVVSVSVRDKVGFFHIEFPLFIHQIGIDPYSEDVGDKVPVAPQFEGLFDPALQRDGALCDHGGFDLFSGERCEVAFLELVKGFP